MDTVKTLTEKVEEDYLKLLINIIENNKLPLAEAKTITTSFLSLYPFSSIEDMKDKLMTFTRQNSIFETIYHNFLKNIDDIRVNDVLGKMKTLIRENKIDEALQVAR